MPLSNVRTAILLTKPASSADVRRHLGAADYSYGFVEQALRPILDQLGDVRDISRPESQLSWAAARARADGQFPVHLCISPPHAAFLPSDVPTILFPFWEFPRVPDRDFGFDTRQNWGRTLRQADRIVCACESTAQAIRAVVHSPIASIAVPFEPKLLDIPHWNPAQRTRLDCRHLELKNASEYDSDPLSPSSPRPRLGKPSIRRAYNARIRPFLSAKALDRMKSLRTRFLRMPDMPPQRLPVGNLELGGLVYLSVFNFSDRRKNALDMLSAFLLAFRDRPDVTLVWKLACNAQTEFDEVNQVLAMYRSLGISHKCKVVVITDYLDDDQMRTLYQACAFYLNTSRAEGACLPLQEAMAAGRPCIAPVVSAMRDYVDEEVGFPIESSREPTYWPHDPEKRIETTWGRLSWSSLRAQLISSAQLASDAGGRHCAMSDSARRRIRHFAGRDCVRTAWAVLLASLDTHGALAS
jgi:glycosyltransferase involved in cell wall biosynthesis